MSFHLALEAITEKHREDIEEERKFQIDEDFPIESFIDVPEDKETGITYMFYDYAKIHIEVIRLQVV